MQPHIDVFSSIVAFISKSFCNFAHRNETVMALSVTVAFCMSLYVGSAGLVYFKF
jgi:hypothetical protein